MGLHGLVLTCIAAMLLVGSRAAQSDVIQAFDADVPFKPVVGDSAGQPQLVHELHLTNFAQRPIILERVTVLETAGGKAIAAFEGDILARQMGRVGQTGPMTDRQIAPGMRGLVYFNLPLGTQPPRIISHRIDFRIADDPQPRQLDSAVVDIDARNPLVLGPPLRGGPWAAVYAPEMERGHRRVVYATNGAAMIPGRFAIDWIRIDSQGRRAPDGATRLDAFYGHGSEVLAVADATVASVRDDMAEAATLEAVPKVSIGDASGNYVALDLGDGRYAFYEHLRRGVRVRPGQRVKRGQVIGQLGLTGQGSSPHLHFHIANANSLLGAEGLPFVLNDVEVLGGYASIEAFGRGGPWSPATGSTRRGRLTPAPNMVVRFPQ